MEGLKKCPFCGGEARLQALMWPRFVYCTSCYARTTNCTAFGTQEGAEQAIEAWNRRVKDGQETQGAAG